MPLTLTDSSGCGLIVLSIPFEQARGRGFVLPLLRSHLLLRGRLLDVNEEHQRTCSPNSLARVLFLLLTKKTPQVLESMPKGPVCILGAGYSSGWVSSCFHFPSELLAVELLCKAKGGALLPTSK